MEDFGESVTVWFSLAKNSNQSTSLGLFRFRKLVVMPVYLFPMKRIMDRLMVQYIRIHDYSICLLVHTKIWMLQIWGVINFCLFNAIRYWCHWAIQVQVVWKLYMPRSAIYEAHGVLKPNLCVKYNFAAKGTSHINICRIYNNRIHTN